MSIMVNEDGVRYTEIPKDYSDGMTKQSFKDSTDINKIIKKAQTSAGLAHAMKYDKPVYGEFSGVDLLTAFNQVEKAKQIFADLPSEVRNEFNQDPFKFMAFASHPNNIDRLDKLIPKIAEPGRHFPKPGDEPIEVRVVASAATESGDQGGGSPSSSAAPGDAPAAAPEASGDAPASSAT